MGSLALSNNTEDGVVIVGLFSYKRTTSGGVTHTKCKNKKTGLVKEFVSVKLGNNRTRSTSSTGVKKTRKTW